MDLQGQIGSDTLTFLLLCFFGVYSMWWDPFRVGPFLRWQYEHILTPHTGRKKVKAFQATRAGIVITIDGGSL